LTWGRLCPKYGARRGEQPGARDDQGHRLLSPGCPEPCRGMKPPTIQIAIVDDEALLAQTLGAWLARDRRLRIVGCAENGEQGWELCAATRPEVALVDVEMEGGDGLTLAQRLRQDLPGTRVIIMTGRVDPHTAWRAGQLGVQGLIDKTLSPEVLRKVIHVVVDGGQFLSTSFQRVRSDWLSKPQAFQKVLTNRELAVLHRVTEGQSDEEICHRLGISAETVACHRKSLRRKLDLHDDRSLVAYGRKWGIFGAGKTVKAKDPLFGGGA
jgi:DNA-binding NarL/FixJ family response regulator